MSSPHSANEFVRSSGVLLFDAEGQDHLDAAGSAQSVGHANARVADAIRAGAESLGPAGDQRRSGYGKALLATLPDGFDTIRFACSASEANDLAIRIARQLTGGRGMIVSRNAYHGVTVETAAISPALGSAAALPGWIRVVDAPTADSATFAASVAAAASELRDSEYGLCALIVDPVFVSDGVAVVSLADAATAVRDAGGVVIADEVQSGFGRTGVMWGFESAGVRPDLVTAGKSMGNGASIAAVLGGAAMRDVVADHAGYTSSTAGDAVSVAAAQAVLDSILDDDLLGNARSIGQYLLAGLALLASAGVALGEVRGRGLCVAMDVIGHGGAPDAARAAALVEELSRRRILVTVAGLHESVLIIRPPLTVTVADVDRLLEQLYGALLVVEPTDYAPVVLPGPGPVTAPDPADAVDGEPDAEDTTPDP